MRVLRPGALLLILAACLLLPALIAVAQDGRRLARDLQRDLGRASSVEDKMDVLRRATEADGKDTVEFLVDAMAARGMDDPRLRTAAAEVLAGYTSEEAWDEILDSCGRRGARHPLQRLMLAEACSMARRSEANECLRELIMDERNPAVVLLALRGIRDKRDSGSVEAIRELIDESDSERIIGAAVDALAGAGQRDQVVPIILEVLRDEDKARGQALEPIRQALVRLFGGDYDMQYDADGWEEIWMRIRSAEASGGGAELTGVTMPEPIRRPPYYGIPIDALRVVFVIDCSGSMLQPIDPALKQQMIERDEEEVEELRAELTGGSRNDSDSDSRRDRQEVPDPEPLPWHRINTKMDLAKEELKRCLRQLPEEVCYAIVAYSTDVWIINPDRLVPATPSNKASSIDRVDNLSASGMTNIITALLTAFTLHTGGAIDLGLRADNMGEVVTVLNSNPALVEQGATAIFFLTDGSPTFSHTANRAQVGQSGNGGGASHTFSHPNYLNDICNDVAAANEVREVKIHCIGVGQHDRSLLARLAQESGGEYRDTNRP